MAEITWQTVNAPSNADVFRGMLLASQGVNSAVDSFNTMGTQITKANNEAMKQQDDAKSFAIKSLLAGTKNVGEVDALMPKIQQLAGGMNDLGKAGPLVSSIMPDAQKQYTARESAGTAGFNATKAAITQPLEQAKIQGETDVGFKTLGDQLKTFGLTAQTKVDDDLFKAQTIYDLVDTKNQTWADTEQSKTKLARAEAAALLDITPKLSDIGQKTIELRVPQAQQALDIAANASISDKTKAIIAGQDQVALAAAEETKAKIAEARDKTLQALTAPEDRADVKVKAASDTVGAYDAALTTHKASYASADAVTKYLTDNKVDPADALNLTTNYNKAVLDLKKEYPEYDIDHMPLNALKTIVGASNLSPATWFNETSSDEIKGQLKNYFESGTGREDTKANLETESRIATERFRASQDYDALRAKRKPESVLQEQAAVKNLEAQTEKAKLKKEAEIATEGGFFGESIKERKSVKATPASTSLFPPTKHTFDLRRLLGSDEEIKARDAKVKARKEAQKQLLQY